VIDTERLVLRRLREDDLDDFADIFAKDPVMRYSNYQRGLTRAESAELLERLMSHWDEHGFGHWGVAQKSDEILLGYEGLAIPFFLPEVLPAVEIGYRLDPSAWGKGYATEAGRAALSYGFETLDLKRIIAIYDVENVRSGRVMERLGMHVERDTLHPEQGVTLRVYELHRDEWRVGQKS
jgi:RimJ/RimL family protein N-acetyltransferase